MTRSLAIAVVWLLLGVALAATSTAAAASGAKHPRYLWTQPGPWGDPSSRAAANGLEFWMPHTRWAVAVGETGDRFVQFTKMHWQGWRTAAAVATGWLEDCYVVGPRCDEPVRVRLVLTGQRPMSCGHESPAAGALVYTRYELFGYRRLAGVQHATRVC